jgi:alpha-glucosidase
MRVIPATLPLALLFTAITAVVPLHAAAPVERYRLESGGRLLEISAPRDDIIRIRAGQGTLPEDASWAVPQSVRARHIPLNVEEGAERILVSTAALTVELARSSLQVRILDRAGHVVLEDAPDGAPQFSHGVHLRKVMPPDMHYFGLGDKSGRLDRRGGSFALWNTDAYGFGEGSDPLYKSIPFVLGVGSSGASVGLFFDSTWRSYFDFGRTERDTLRFGADAGPVDYYVIGAAAPKAVVQAYAYLTGIAALPPLWSLGFQQSRYSYMTETEARGIATRLRADHIPADVLYLDIDYQDRNRPFTVNRQSFPDLPKFLADMRALDLRVVMITDLHIAAAPGEGYAPYDTGQARDAFLKNPDGSTYVADVWPGASVFPDFSRSGVRDWWGGLYTGFLHAGAAGFWNDMNEPAIFNVRGKTMPLDVVHRIDEPGFAPRSATHAEMHNVYGMLNSRATWEGLLRLDANTRPFVLTRASYAGGQRYAATWTGDNLSAWSHLRLSVAQLANLGLSGFALAGDDIGGFGGAGPSPELLTRWIEIGAFNPIFRDHAATGKPAQELWTGGADQEAIRRRYVEERYRLLPYIYQLAEEYSRTGLPLLRPVFLEFPARVDIESDLGGSIDQFMLGPSLLVAPATEPESPFPYDITLPGDGWFDYWTGLRVPAAKFSQTPRLELLPVFVRPGSIVPHQPLVQSTAERPRGNLRLDVYPGPSCHGELYLDDGVSFDYRRGAYLRQGVFCQGASQVAAVEFAPREGSFRPWWHDVDVVIHGVDAAPARVRLDGRPVASRHDAAGHALHVTIADPAGATRLTLESP